MHEKQRNVHGFPESPETIRRIEIRSRRLASELFGGEYHSSFKGRGIEFSSVREYQYGDDVRTIDWNTSARKHELYVKQFIEERERSMLLLVDASASMLFGGGAGSKRLLSAEVGAVLAFSAVQNNDKVGLVIFTDRVETYIPPGKGRQQVLQILEALFGMQPQHTKTDIDAALSFVSHIRKRQAIVFLLSDLLDCRYERGMKLLNARHDFVLIHISDPLERELLRTGLLDLQDPETGSRITIDAGSQKALESYRNKQLRHADDLSRKLMRMKIDTVRLETGRSFIGELNTFFRYREKRY
ncbi:MAG: DUF58 domain-containing protein [Chlorobium sp.]|uniref:DUF58 domain-containing protein n=1 Tax=Chlorobium sp. TaxID=1095 RepID=UPI0025BAE6A5|nr:DUF58 domain-containing protein [Chlorobium sp.]MCF8216558.1 DUF58 domain-containing protein [Chlorobium sp.]MCF8270885.1 DUF58 domain-containing protein [Chlorobium sp.]MCF8287181.1 DUF58 domain-containing protein [Chlorobium sp.]MCF8290838.1 DUF58 domain-containing protein [Chlorobium sp.]MCF8385469.1 DUF58 domain-containing protein [Chlorobium sp.]